jgi:dTDP-4-amino-4,6-dideoxygalactose transaminase
MSEIDCDQMMVKTKYLDQWQARRRKIAEYWCERLHSTGIRSLIDEHNSYNHAFHKFVIFTEQRDILQRNLALRKIETKIHYKNPLHEIGIYTQYPGPGMLATGSSMCRGILSLPIYPELTDLEVEYIIDSVIDHA